MSSITMLLCMLCGYITKRTTPSVTQYVWSSLGKYVFRMIYRFSDTKSVGSPALSLGHSDVQPDMFKKL